MTSDRIAQLNKFNRENIKHFKLVSSKSQKVLTFSIVVMTFGLVGLSSWFGVKFLSEPLSTYPIKSFNFYQLPNKPLFFQTSILLIFTVGFTLWLVLKRQKDNLNQIIQTTHLLELERKHRETIDFAPALLWSSDSHKILTWFSSGWLSFTGKSAEEESKNGWISGIHPDDIGNYLSVFIESVDLKKEFRIQYRLLHHSGEYRWITSKGLPHFDENGMFLGFVGSCMDIHELKMNEIKLNNTLFERNEFLSVAAQELKTSRTSTKFET